jgi:hypothetical protein
VRSRTAGAGAIIAGLSYVAFVGSVVQYAPVDHRLLLISLYIGVAIGAAILGSGGAVPGWQTPAVIAVLATGGGLALWPDAHSWNYVFEPLLLPAGAAIACAVIVWRGRDRSLALRTRAEHELIDAARPALIWGAAIGLGAIGLLLLASFNPFAVGFIAGAVTLIIATALALRHAPRRGVAILIGVLATPIPVVALAGLLVATQTVTLDRRYEIPASYRGWVVIEHLAPDCPPLRQDAGALVFPVDARGCGCTSNEAPKGFSRWTYVAIASDGTRTELPQTDRGGGALIWASSSGSSSARSHPWEQFFIGTEDELQQAGRSQFAQESRCLGSR